MRTQRFILAAALVLFAACAKEEFNEVQTGGFSPEYFICHMDQGTKAFLQEKDEGVSKVYWEAGDAIRVFSATNTTGVKYIVEPDIIEPWTAKFTKDPEDEGNLGNGPYYAVYPYAATSTLNDGAIVYSNATTQTWVENSFDPTQTPAYAKSNDTDFYFSNLFGIVKIPVKCTSATSLSKIVITAEGGLTGTTTVTFDPFSIATEYKDSTTVTVAAAEPQVASAENAVTFYVALPAGSMENGGIATIYNTDGLGYSAPIAKGMVVRSQVTEMPALTCAHFVKQAEFTFSAEETLIYPGGSAQTTLKVVPEEVTPTLEWIVEPAGAASVDASGKITFSSTANGIVKVTAKSTDTAIPLTMKKANASRNFLVAGDICDITKPEYSGQTMTITTKAAFAEYDVTYTVNGEKFEDTGIVESVAEDVAVPCTATVKIDDQKFSRKFEVNGIKPYFFEFNDWASVPGIEAGAIIGFYRCVPAFSPDGKKAYLKSFLNKNVYLVSINLEQKKIDWARKIKIWQTTDLTKEQGANCENMAILVNPVNGWIYVGSDRTDIYAYDADGNLKFNKNYKDFPVVPAPREYAIAISKDGKWLYVGNNDNSGMTDKDGNSLYVADALTGEHKTHIKGVTGYQLFVKENSANERIIFANSRANKKIIAYKHTIDGDGNHSLTKLSGTEDLDCAVTKFSYPTAIAQDGDLYDCRATAAGIIRDFTFDGSGFTLAGTSAKIHAGQVWSVEIGPNTAAESGGIAGDYRVFTSGVFKGGPLYYSGITADTPHGASGRLQEVLELGTYANGNRALHYAGLTINEKGGAYITPYLETSPTSGDAVKSYCPSVEANTWRNWGWSSANPQYNDVQVWANTTNALQGISQGAFGQVGNIYIVGTYNPGKESGFIRLRYTKYARANGYWCAPGGDPCKTSNWNVVYNK